MNALRWVLPLISQRRAAFFGTIASSLLHQLGILALSATSALFLGHALFSASFPDEWRMLATVIAALALAVAVLAWWESYISHDLAYALLAVLRSTAFTELARSSPARTGARSGSDDTASVMGDVETLEWLFAHTIAQMLTSIVVLGVGGTLSALISPQLIGVWAAAAVLLFALPWALSRWGLTQGRKTRSSAVHVHSLFVETIQGIGDLTAAGELPQRLRRVEKADQELARWQLRSGTRASLEGALSETIVAGAGILAILLMGATVRDGRTPPELVAVAMVLAMGTLGPAAQIAGLLKNFGTLIASTNRLHTVFTAPDAAPAPDSPVHDIDPTQAGSLEFVDVSFGYNPDSPVLHSISFRIRPGESVALAGPSGAGKSTIAALALRTWDPDTGQVRIGGAPADRIEDPLLRRAVTAVPQEAHLMRGTVRTNLLLARPDASDAQVEQAADAALLRDPRSGLPEGLDTPVGERGDGLSGGQRARVSFARALLTGADILVLDEAAAHLDPHSEDDLTRALRTHADLTTLVIAHRTRTILACDRVLVLDGGRIVEEGAPQALLEDRDSHLSALLERELTIDTENRSQ